MAKRFTDTEIWDKPWFMELSPKLKCLVKLIRDKCDNSGTWQPNWILANAYIGENVSEEELLAIDNGQQFEKLDNGKIFCVGFIFFQYGKLSEKCKPHKKVIELLKKHKIYERVSKGYPKGIHTLQEEEEEEEEEKDIKGGLGENEETLLIQAAERIRKLHPKIRQPIKTDVEIKKAIRREFDKGHPMHEAIAYVEGKTKLYAMAAELKSPKDKQYLVGSLNWYQNGGYLEKPESWGLDDDSAGRPIVARPEVVL